MSRNAGRFRLHTADGLELKLGLEVWVLDQQSKAYQASVVWWETTDCMAEVRVLQAPPGKMQELFRPGARIRVYAGFLYAARPAQPIAGSEYRPGGPGRKRRRRAAA